MTPRAYYNEIDKGAAAWLRELIAADLIAPGDVDERSIADVRPVELAGYTQCHFFAGIGGWSLALRSAGWPDHRPVWTGSCPCQPFSNAGKRAGFADDRHLWPFWRYLVAQCRPPRIYGEQVASAADWLRLVRGDLEALGYSVGAIPIEAASAGADHLRDRYWFVAHADHAGPQGRGILPERAGERASGPDGLAQTMGDTNSEGWHREGQPGEAVFESTTVERSGGRGTGDYEWVIGADGKARRVKPGIRLLVDGLPGRVGLLRGFGNAIDPRPAVAFIRATDEALRELI